MGTLPLELLNLKFPKFTLKLDVYSCKLSLMGPKILRYAIVRERCSVFLGSGSWVLTSLKGEPNQTWVAGRCVHVCVSKG